MHKYLNYTTRSVAWLRKVMLSKELDQRPPFQRNPVWSERQKSALIETILLEYPIPEVYMQELTEADGNQKFIIVDGQQRINSVLSFLEGDFDLTLDDSKWHGLAFDDLAAEDKKKIYEYSFVVRVLPEVPDAQLRDIFLRINRYTMTLNPQELRHATYWGPFIKLMEELSNLDFWSYSGLFSSNDKRRMLDVEFISELAVAFLNGAQNKKKNLEEYYQIYEKEFEQEEKLRTAFTKIITEIEAILPNIRETRWRKKSDFYTLFLYMARFLDRIPLAKEERVTLTVRFTRFSADVDNYLQEGITAENELTEYIKSYAENVEKAASDLGSRLKRIESLANEIGTI